MIIILKDGETKKIYIKTSSTDCQQSNWEDQTSKSMENNQFKIKQRQFEDQQRRLLDIRRRNLFELMHNEGSQYGQEIIKSQETPEQVRLKMEAQLIKLKAQKEKDRLGYVHQLNERRFFESADELRKNESDNLAIACYYEQENQMLDKLKTKNREKSEEAYAKLSELDYMRKIEREKDKEQEKRQKIQRTYDYLKWQREEEKEFARRSAQLNQIEKSRFMDQLKRDKQSEEEEKQRRYLVNVSVYKDIDDYNKKEDIEKKKRSHYEKIQDKELIDSINKKETALALIDKREKEKKKKEFQENNRYMEYKMNQKKEEETWMDKIAQDESNRQFKTKQGLWLKEEAKRIELLKNVYKERQNSVLFKKNCRGEEKKEIEKERKILDEEIQRYNDRLEEINRENAMIRKAHQNELVYQISKKEEQKKRDIQDKLYEERDAYLWEIEYQKKINQQKEIHKQKLAEIKNKGYY